MHLRKTRMAKCQIRGGRDMPQLFRTLCEGMEQGVERVWNNAWNAMASP